MRIAYDGLTITDRPAGIGGSALEILAHLAALADAPEIVAVLPRGSAGDARIAHRPNVEIVRAPVDGPDTPRALWFQHVSLPRLLRDRRCDALIAPSFVVPLVVDPPPALVAFYDASWRRFPATKSRKFRAYMDRAVPLSCEAARGVVACSEFARSEVLDIVPGLAPEKVSVIPLGTRALAVPADVDAALRRVRVKPPYLLAVSNFDPRKNLGALVRAWRRLRAEDALPHALVLVGDPIRAARFRERIGTAPGESLVTPGYVTDEELAALYARADLVVVPSLYEGFGLPVLEAFRAGAPVACADRASLPEVAGDAAVLFDPEDDGAVVRAIRTGLRAGAERDDRVARGRARAATYTWERTARAWLDLTRRTLTR
ncbi:MAG: glycosyltransferase family 4 protein [Planctomycetes bacterium]|nr:glycosyltransferase family 4 protein [Planctomycetota bacterium]